MGETIREKADRLSREPHIRPFIMDDAEETGPHPVLEHYREFLKGGPPPATDFQPMTPEELNREAYLDGIGDEQFMEYVKNTRPELYARWMAGPQFKHIRFDGEETLAIYRALQTYLKVLSQQEVEDLEMIARVTRLMIAIKPQAVEASQEIANRNTAS